MDGYITLQNKRLKSAKPQKCRTQFLASGYVSSKRRRHKLFEVVVSVKMERNVSFVMSMVKH